MKKSTHLGAYFLGLYGIKCGKRFHRAWFDFLVQPNLEDVEC